MYARRTDSNAHSLATPCSQSVTPIVELSEVFHSISVIHTCPLALSYRNRKPSVPTYEKSNSMVMQ